MHFTPFSPVGLVSWNVVLPSCVSVSTELSEIVCLEIGRTFLYNCWFDGHTYNRSTTSTSYADIFRSPRRPSCSASLVAALPPRSWPRTSQTAAGADDPTPAGFASAATSALSSFGGPATARLPVASSVLVSSVTYSLLSLSSLFHMSDDLPECF